MFNLIEKQITKEYTLFDFIHFISYRNKYAQKYMENSPLLLVFSMYPHWLLLLTYNTKYKSL